MKSSARSVGATKKRRVSRNPTSGQFEAASPYDDPETLAELVRVVRAVRDLEPMLSASVLMFKQLGDQESAALASMVGTYLATIKQVALDDLSVDSETFKEVQKLRLEAKRLGNVPLSEQQRIQALAGEWQLDGMTPAKLAQAAPQVLQTVMKFAAGRLLAIDNGQTDEPAAGGGA